MDWGAILDSVSEKACLKRGHFSKDLKEMEQMFKKEQ